MVLPLIVPPEESNTKMPTTFAAVVAPFVPVMMLLVMSRLVLSNARISPE